MRKYLDTPKIDYIIAHLKYRCDFSDELYQRMVFIKDMAKATIPENRIVFPLSNKERVTDYQIDELTILYPVFRDKASHTFNENSSLIFSHDILQEIFCLQTLYYEQEIEEKDSLGRIKPEATLNFQLGFLNKAIVDYLFAVIVDELEEYSLQHNLPFKRTNLTAKHTFLLSHDIDRVETYSFYNMLYFGKRLLFSPNTENLKNSLLNLKEFFRFQNRDNPLWDFPKLRQFEKEFQLNSTYYFLNKGKLHQDAYYSLNSPRMLKLINDIQSDNNEIGLHLTIAGNKNESLLNKNLAKLNSLTKDNIVGARSHWLRFEPTITPDILQKLGIKYDSSIAHYSQEGFRSGTCLPYRLFSFKENKMLDVWEIPLIYMDCMILDYQNISEELALHKLQNLLTEVIKFRGVYSVLWHNGNFSKQEPFNRYNFYRKLISMILETNPLNMTAKSMIEKLEERR
jgi:hypothetical protein